VSNLAEIARLKKKLEWQLAGDKLSRYAPYRWQQKFHFAGPENPERMLMAANRVGKTTDGGAETALHMTGLYDELPRHARYMEFLPNGERHPNAGELIWPEGWKGVRFNKPVLAWTGSPTNETSKGIVQTELLGGLGEALGTGWVPRRLIVGDPQTRQAGVKGVIESFNVRHVTGGLSRCSMKTYEQGWQKWQGEAPEVIWLDEEPDDYMIYSESQTRILTSRGILIVTFTPLLGVTELVEHFQTGGKGIYVQGATWDDAPHLSKADRDRLAASFRSHERDARTQGIPMMGEGAVFPIGDDEIKVEAFAIPRHWARIKGCDFGMDHPAAGVEIAHDRETDTIYLIDCYRKANEKAPYHAAWLNKTNPQIPIAWPHDGMNREKSGGRNLADAYRQHNANMLSKSARYPKVPGEDEKGGPQPVEPIVDEMLERMQTGRFKAFAHLAEFFEEKRSYHRKDGVIQAKRDDILKALFYAVMMKRYAVSLAVLGRASSVAPMAPIATTRI
jgi:phage terminase large subunit-like protein